MAPEGISATVELKVEMPRSGVLKRNRGEDAEADEVGSFGANVWLDGINGGIAGASPLVQKACCQSQSEDSILARLREYLVRSSRTTMRFTAALQSEENLRKWYGGV